MKTIFYTALVILGFVFPAWNNYAFSAEAEIKKVCLEQKDAKTGKSKQVCKEVKMHKKLEGTNVPVKSK